MRMPTNSESAPSGAKITLATADLLALDAQAVHKSIEIVSRATPEDMTKPTPCRAWTLYGLLAHMATQHYGFAAASRGEADHAAWRLRWLGDDPVGAYREAAEHVLKAFAADGVLDRTFPMVEFEAEVPGHQAVSFHIVDYVVHSWDVARTLGIPVEFEPELVEISHEVIAIAPPGEARVVPGVPFGPVVPWSGGSRLDQLLAFLGRSPNWPN